MIFLRCDIMPTPRLRATNQDVVHGNVDYAVRQR